MNVRIQTHRSRKSRVEQHRGHEVAVRGNRNEPRRERGFRRAKLRGRLEQQLSGAHGRRVADQQADLRDREVRRAHGLRITTRMASNRLTGTPNELPPLLRDAFIPIMRRNWNKMREAGTSFQG